jgi:hypothetical protein
MAPIFCAVIFLSFKIKFAQNLFAWEWNFGLLVVRDRLQEKIKLLVLRFWRKHSKT